MPKTELSISKDVYRKHGSFTAIILGVACSTVMFFALLLSFSATWYIKHYGDTGFDSVLFTLLSNMHGVDGGLVASFLKESLVPTVLCGGLLIFLIYFIQIRPWCKNVIAIVIAFIFFIVAGNKVNIFGYINKLMHQSTLYEEYFVEPDKDNIIFPEKKRNLIYIFLESIETTYLSSEEGGALSEKIIPELSQLAEENISFSHNEGVGGFLTPSGTGWTVAGMVAQSSGVPLKGSSGALENNEYGKDVFLPGVTALSDILHQNGYTQAVMMGSDSSYANRDVYYKGHKTDYIYDINSAKKDNVVDDDYYVWWGMEDSYVYEYAKDKLDELAKSGEPFAFTLLTADTHFPDGYNCELCKDTYDEPYDNVISCASRQVEKFIDWIMEQDFYENTTVIICGDHLSMDYQYIKRNVSDIYDRRVYNCFINSAVTGKNYKNRTFTSLDLFPTTLAAMGCEIKGNRLGLGTNLFSDFPTLAEEMGYEEFDHELLFSSNYYIKKFMIN